jgi:hypothetical protein
MPNSRRAVTAGSTSVRMPPSVLACRTRSVMIYVHNVGRNQEEWIEAFAREVLLRLAH